MSTQTIFFTTSFSVCIFLGQTLFSIYEQHFNCHFNVVDIGIESM